MIDVDVLLKILPIFLLGAMSPGPDFMMVSSISLSRGRLEGVKTAAGIATVITFYTLIGLTGLTILFDRFIWLVAAIKICGGIYLIYLGIKIWRASLTPDLGASATKAIKRQKSSYLTGIFVCLTNPKAIAFFASIFALGLTPDASLATKAALQIAVPLIAFGWFSFVAFGLSKPFIRSRYQRWQKTIDRITGTALGLFGLKLLFLARN